jgi:hypothetical protein
VINVLYLAIVQSHISVEDIADKRAWKWSGYVIRMNKTQNHYQSLTIFDNGGLSIRSFATSYS